MRICRNRAATATRPNSWPTSAAACEQTEDRVVDMAADAGIHPTTFQRLAKPRGLGCAMLPPPRDLPAAAKLAAEAEELAALSLPRAAVGRSSAAACGLSPVLEADC